MTVLNRLERALCSLYVAITYPIVWIGNRWMERIESLERPEEPQGLAEDGTLYPHKIWESSPRELTISDIRPAGMIKVHALDAEGKWQQLNDYPVRLLPKVPGIEIRGGD